MAERWTPWSAISRHVELRERCRRRGLLPQLALERRARRVAVVVATPRARRGLGLGLGLGPAAAAVALVVGLGGDVAAAALGGAPILGFALRSCWLTGGQNAAGANSSASAIASNTASTGASANSSSLSSDVIVRIIHKHTLH